MNDSPEWNKTVLAVERLRKKPFFEEPSKESRYGKYQGRNIIGRDCPINGGVYLGGGEREAIVVDDKKQPELLSAYKKLLRRRRIAQKLRGESFKEGLLKEVFDLTQELLPYNDRVVADITRRLQPDQKISLSVFLTMRGGVCRHQALLVAYLLEKLKNEGHVQGRVSVDRNYIPGKGGHAWVRYVNSAGEVFIIDPAQNFIGRIDEAGKNQWFYERPSTLRDSINKLFRFKRE